MARIRYLKPDFFTDEDLADLPFETRLLFAGLWCYADKDGRLEDRPKYLKAMIFPYDKVDVEKNLTLLTSPKPFIIRYEVDGKRLIEIPNWSRHQKPHHTEADSRIPPAPPLITGMEKGMGKGMEKQHEASSRLRNGEITVKEPLENGKGTEKTRFLDFVFLTSEEYQKLTEKLGQDKTDDLIDQLNTAIGSKGYKYKSHYYTILNWDRRGGGNGKQEDEWDRLKRQVLSKESANTTNTNHQRQPH